MGITPMTESLMDKSVVNVFSFVAAFAFFTGCQHAPTTGGDSPVTTQRLTGSRLTDIRENLSWTFSDNTVVIENKDQAIPPDVVQELLGDRPLATRIQATWRLDEKAGMLRLSNAKADGDDSATDINIRINPAGHVRVNLGSRQYNLSRITKNP